MTTQEQVTKSKIGLLGLPAYLKNVSETCRVREYSRDNFYIFKKCTSQDIIEHLPSTALFILFTTSTGTGIVSAYLFPLSTIGSTGDLGLFCSRILKLRGPIFMF